MATPRVPKVPFTTAELRSAADPTTDIASLIAFVVQRAVAYERSGSTAPRRSRGQRLRGFEFLAMFVFAVWFDASPRVIARVFGMNHTTVRRYLATTRFRKFREASDRAVAAYFSLRRPLLAARARLIRDS